MTDDLFAWAEKTAAMARQTGIHTQAPPPAVTMYDLLPIKDQLAAFQVVIAAMLNEAQALDVTDDQSNREAVSRASAAKKKWKEIEDTRKTILTPHADFIAAVNRLAKDCQGPLADVEKILKTKISAYQTRIELDRRKQEEAARLATIELQKKIDAEAALNNVAPPQVIAPVMPAVQTVTRTEAGTASQVKSWDFAVVEEAAVPREYLIVDLRLVRQAVKNGVRSIPGVNIFEKQETRIRT